MYFYIVSINRISKTSNNNMVINFFITSTLTKLESELTEKQKIQCTNITNIVSILSLNNSFTNVKPTKPLKCSIYTSVHFLQLLTIGKINKKHILIKPKGGIPSARSYLHVLVQAFPRAFSLPKLFYRLHPALQNMPSALLFIQG